MMRTLRRVLCAGLTLVLAGCSVGPAVDMLPGDMGLPKGAPARPTEVRAFPAVHDMPPNRSTTPLNEEEQVRLEKDLQTVRDRQEAKEGQKPQAAAVKKLVPVAAKKPDPVTKKQSDGVIVVPPAGVKANP